LPVWRIRVLAWARNLLPRAAAGRISAMANYRAVVWWR
jgi:hypothetical protein